MTVEIFKPADTFCANCFATARWLDKLGVPYEERPLTDEVRDEFYSQGFREVPIVVAFGRAHSGFKAGRLQEIAHAYHGREEKS